MNSKPFHLQTPYSLSGDQPQAVDALVRGIEGGSAHQVLLGVTGSGKTFTMANVIARLNRPALVISPNKTLAGQLYNEFKELFPDNAVEYFVSYYDYYQPEAYVPATDTFIEKDASINDRIDRLRHAATIALLERRDVIVVASVSCIYGLGSPEIYRKMAIPLRCGEHMDRDSFLRRLLGIQYERNDYDLLRGHFRVRGDTVEIITAASEARSVRVLFDGDLIESLQVTDPLTGKALESPGEWMIYPANHYATEKSVLLQALSAIETELQERLAVLKSENKLLEHQRLDQRTRYDLEIMRETGYCSGIENYSRFIDQRQSGEPPHVLVDYFPEDSLVFIDESHVTVPQIGGMHAGDRSRKQTLVDFGFRLPSALDNRPLNFAEFEGKTHHTIYVSATPGDFEIERSGGAVTEQIIRPTGLSDPPVEMRPTLRQVDDLLEEIRKVTAGGDRVLVTTLTKKMAEKLTDYYAEAGIAVRYLHADVPTMERMVLLRDLREGVFSVLVGINLLREGLDLPEVALVGILEADQEGFLRSRRSLIQMFGRASRNTRGRVILYADRETRSIRDATMETARRREIQLAYNAKHGITAQTVSKSMGSHLVSIYEKDYLDPDRALREVLPAGRARLPKKGGLQQEIKKLRGQMQKAARRFHFEEAARLRDEVFRMEKILDTLL